MIDETAIRLRFEALRPNLDERGRRDPTLLEDLRGLLEPATVGDPMRPLLWVSNSHAKLAVALREMGHQVSATRIPHLLKKLGYCRQLNRKTKEGANQGTTALSILGD